LRLLIPAHPSRQLDNLVFIINCNLQRLDGPVTGNGKIINELEGIFVHQLNQLAAGIFAQQLIPATAPDDFDHFPASTGKRLDGPVTGNGKIINELEGIFAGAGWEVIKVIWGGRWDEESACRWYLCAAAHPSDRPR
jgi:pyruvate dehydrogenase complex dehydrogenase (E1) component